jgi:hypothetical protein
MEGYEFYKQNVGCACLDEVVKYGQSLFGDIKPKTMKELVEFVRK